MKLEIILLLIAVQVVYKVMSKRKAAKQAEEASRNPAASRGPAQGGPAGAAVTPRKPQAIPDGRNSYDEARDQEDWDEHHMSGESRDARPAAGQPPQPDRTGNAPAAGQGKAADLGKDLLSQLARELGLEIPSAPQRKPASAPAARPQPAQPVGQKTKADTARPTSQATTLSKRVAEKGAVKTDADGPTDRYRNESVPREAPGNTPVTAEPMARSLSDLTRESLGDAESIRRAFILKTILDKPISLQPR
ncbi:MAG: hypothetical protein JWO30_1404 [Fibrobacteres bacterium]|nr:hypothetical protein [Fibrobacterota bacterium]